MPLNAGRQWRRYEASVRQLPALTLKVHNMRMDHQILHYIARVAFETRPMWRRLCFDRSLLVDRNLRARVTSALFLLAGVSRELRLGSPFHSAGFDVRFNVRTPGTALEPRNLIAQGRHCSLQFDILLPQRDEQAL